MFIGVAMIVGVVIFGGLGAFVSTLGSGKDSPPPALPASPTIVAFVVSLVCSTQVVFGFFLRRARLAKSLRTEDPAVRATAFVGGSVVGLALCESASLLSAGGILATRDIAPFAPGFAIGLLGMLALFPTPAAFDRHLAEPASTAA
jgi:hypothetical protein